MTVAPALATKSLSKSFGALRATDDVSFELAHGARHAIIGPNGAGKTTLINLLTGMLTPSSGTISLYGNDITRAAPELRVRRGLVRTFQINSLFPALTPFQATLLAVCQRLGLSWNMLRRASNCEQAVEETMALLQRLGLADDGYRVTSELPYGRQRLLEIALALAANPKVLLLDEPAAGVPRQESAELFDTIAKLPQDVSILFIEHDMELVFRFAEKITVMANGRILREGTPAEIARDPRVRAVYLADEVEL